MEDGVEVGVLVSEDGEGDCALDTYCGLRDVERSGVLWEKSREHWIRGPYTDCNLKMKIEFMIGLVNEEKKNIESEELVWAEND